MIGERLVILSLLLLQLEMFINQTSSFRNIPIKIMEFILYANLIGIEMYDFDVVLGMDWLTTHFVVINYQGIVYVSAL